MIRNLLDAVVARFGEPNLELLRSMSDQEAEDFLLALPGVGKKIARCVLMYSLGQQVFPVDTHCWRIARRLGWVRPITTLRERVRQRQAGGNDASDADLRVLEQQLLTAQPLGEDELDEVMQAGLTGQV
ncbi:MAG: hypothetical protein Q8L80_03420 [Gallionella sp.]|nr:hypothetical protein [Gallionella sp.]